jgi:KH-domain-like of EngA bacterial GTPase enzymes, C-terminal
VHGNQTFNVPDSYRRYLSNVFREAFDLFANPVVLEFRTDANPFDRRRALRKTTSKPDVVDRSTTKGKTGGKAGGKARSRAKPLAATKPKSKPKSRPEARVAGKLPKPGSSRSGKDNRRGPKVRAAAGKSSGKQRRR